MLASIILPPFLSTLSLRRATSTTGAVKKAAQISIHALLAESDGGIYAHFSAAWYFYPRSPCGERLYITAHCTIAKQHFYPRSPCGERLELALDGYKGIYISIHALLAESDRRRAKRRLRLHNFYPRSPCGERQDATNKATEATKFLSTLSLRRATAAGLTLQQLEHISIHALLAESDY